MEEQAFRLVERSGVAVLKASTVKAIRPTLIGGSEIYLHEAAARTWQSGSIVVGSSPDSVAGNLGWDKEPAERVVRIVDRSGVTYLKPHAVKAIRETFLGGSDVFLVEEPARSWQKTTIPLSLHPDEVAKALGWATRMVP